MFVKIFLSRKKFEKAVRDEINTLLAKHNESVIATAVYYPELLAENKQLKQTIKNQNTILNAIKIVRNFIHE